MNNCEFLTSLSPSFISKYVPDTTAANALIGTTVYFVVIVGIVCKRVRHLLTGLELTLLWGLGLLSAGTAGFYQLQTKSSDYKMKHVGQKSRTPCPRESAAAKPTAFLETCEAAPQGRSRNKLLTAPSASQSHA